MRRIAMPLWAVVGLAGVAGAAIATAGIVYLREPDAVVTVQSRGTSSSTRAVSTTTTTTPATTTTTTPPTVPTSPPTTIALPPRGSLVVEGVDHFAVFECATWDVRATNNSNTEVVEITFPPHRASYVGPFDPAYGGSHDMPAETPAPVVQRVSIPPYAAQVLSFRACTTSPPSTDPNFSLSIEAPREVRYRWATGHEGTTCFGLFGCNGGP